ncbi:hypothetical protein TUM12370_32280 [Salmonella enterica subsp. enterica serovar Choleraesuis]|nr:hypothetical protein TUM12370_32280 [Salmonella enterica subsp. enterica serovar Choleraesuis]
MATAIIGMAVAGVSEHGGKGIMPGVIIAGTVMTIIVMTGTILITVVLVVGTVGLAVMEALVGTVVAPVGTVVAPVGTVVAPVGTVVQDGMAVARVVTAGQVATVTTNTLIKNNAASGSVPTRHFLFGFKPPRGAEVVYVLGP